MFQPSFGAFIKNGRAPKRATTGLLRVDKLIYTWFIHSCYTRVFTDRVLLKLSRGYMPKSTESKKPLKKPDPFKVRKSKTEIASQTPTDTVTPPEEIAAAIDAFRDAQEQAKHFEGEATVHKNQVVEYSQLEYAKRSFTGKTKSFKLLGEQSMVTYIVMESGSGLTDDDLAEIKERWGSNAADDLVRRDYASIRFDPDVLEANYDAVVQALQTLPAGVVESLFKPMMMKVRKGVSEAVKKYAKTPEDLNELLRQLKVTSYIK